MSDSDLEASETEAAAETQLNEDDRLRPEYVDEVIDRLEAGDGEGVRALVEPLHPADIADLFELVDRDQRRALATALADLLDELGKRHRHLQEGLGLVDLLVLIRENLRKPERLGVLLRVRVNLGLGFGNLAAQVADGVFPVTKPQQERDGRGAGTRVDEERRAHDLRVRQPFEVAEVGVPERRRYGLVTFFRQGQHCGRKPSGRTNRPSVPRAGPRSHRQRA